MPTDRRTFLQLLSTGALSAAFPASIARALEIPANNKTGTINDVEHIVFMMQENRSFDHYFGTLRGVRGYGDPRTITLPSGKSVWYQPDNSNPDGYVLPFHPGAPNLGLQFIEDLDHSWQGTHQAWNNGQNDQWIPAKGTTSMAYLTRSDIPFHYALADAFTVCDAYHCSLLGPTDPNRYHMWTGWVGNDGALGGPVIDNAEAGYDWHTYPERLQAAGVSWKIYQDQGAGLDAAHSWGWGDDAYIGNYGDNSLLYFHQYQNAPANSPLAEKARTGTNISKSGTLFDIFKQDVASGNLPQVSWVVAPEAYTEHPNWPANYGAWYVSQILDALTANPEVWSKTVFIFTFDENDGFFDHVVPPTPPATAADGVSTIDTTNEIFNGSPNYPASTFGAGPYGLGVRVPMVAISPWSKGGYVSSEIFDHTSLIQFIEKRFSQQYNDIIETNITPWRRAVAGDLTSLFNFKNPNSSVVPLPSTVAYVPPDNKRHNDYVPTVPTTQTLPVQEPGIRPARPVPYELNVRGTAHADTGIFELQLGNTGRSAAVYHVRFNGSSVGPWTFTVGPDQVVNQSWDLKQLGFSDYDFDVFGPNGFLRTYKGTISDPTSAAIHIAASYDAKGGITLSFTNWNSKGDLDITYTEAYTGETATYKVTPREAGKRHWPLTAAHGWYDFTVTVASAPGFVQRLAGHVETGKESFTDPAIATSL